MAGTKAGAAKATAIMKARDPDFFKKIGAQGGRVGRIGGFNDPEVARRAAKKRWAKAKKGQLE